MQEKKLMKEKRKRQMKGRKNEGNIEVRKEGKMGGEREGLKR